MSRELKIQNHVAELTEKFRTDPDVGLAVAIFLSARLREIKARRDAERAGMRFEEIQ
jgi:hypothetical protein